MKSPDNHDDIERVFIHSVMFECGILPMERINIDMSRVLNQLSPDEARTVRRKFRKMWRRAAKRTDIVSLRAGLGNRQPTRDQKLARKHMVFSVLWNEAILPMFERFRSEKAPIAGATSAISSGDPNPK